MVISCEYHAVKCSLVCAFHCVESRMCSSGSRFCCVITCYAGWHIIWRCLASLAVAACQHTASDLPHHSLAHCTPSLTLGGLEGGFSSQRAYAFHIVSLLWRDGQRFVTVICVQVRYEFDAITANLGKVRWGEVADVPYVDHRRSAHLPVL